MFPTRETDLSLKSHIATPKSHLIKSQIFCMTLELTSRAAEALSDSSESKMA